MASTKPILAVTMGDPSGTGPELLAMALTDPEITSVCRPLVIGSGSVLEKATRIIGGSAVVKKVEEPAQVGEDETVIHVLDMDIVEMDNLRHGVVDPRNGEAAYRFIEKAVQVTLEGSAHAVVTSAINKKALNDAGYHFDGHTEILAHLTGAPRVTMMLVAGKLRVCHVSTHVSLKKAIERVKPERILDVIKLADAGVREMGVDNPHIAIAGLNPHAGEGGLFGDEEIQFIEPAIQEANKRGYHVSGPYAGDTIFFRTLQGQFDCGVAMYHDQGHVAAKMLGIWLGVNVTLGLPIIRTSVEHG
ncbi:MAG: 4-hydroxythreonine-4-phosphate dehydrogenase PdxA, partial [Verrucomicrobiae bacterium]|nr:4-hydroxythreonine-4-phosphate dehydrogenase PdxA [Verrucomicrobiae bacterium]